ncbi:MAG: ethanolamine ammonia-lyase reactivating factor EutA [Alicyclobacillus macrosporangiidus]|uniref:ethanolamine ammonia-lyase reactivating factor EutA n=1 Tax=Alicyclobacillus macrosporangiidus TaxID=392015 RepID=UPI0026EF761F|nr:ethanolamine ammonia-lyase reactivating factor EutA [Alicyclobacillus macrosporangiidus]MCL6598138.1 ethanolamine ammonia-lyase reactivating factor EutA [Alicyclobacillus macrosporangiidus]
MHDWQWEALWRHDTGDDHWHEDEDLSLENNGLWLSDHIELTSVGIDIGSASTQVVFSRLTLHRLGSFLSSRYNVVSRETLYRSPVHLTPYVDGERIDDQAIGALVEAAYQEAGLTPDAVDTGAVILTGEAIRRHNAEALAHVVSARGGRFVCATAGHNMEALLAAYGSGAVHTSYERGQRLLNIDIGGGTTKYAVVENGRVLETAAIHVGARLLATDEAGHIVRLEPGGEDVARLAGVQLVPGGVVTEEMKRRMGEWMAEAILAAVDVESAPAEVIGLYLTPPLQNRPPYDGVLFSGGVGEYVYGYETHDFGDLGRFIGRALHTAASGLRMERMGPLLLSTERIRATVIGASEHSVQISGNTIYLSSPKVLPVRKLQVLRPHCDLHGDIDPDAVAAAIQAHFRQFDLDEHTADVALAFHFGGPPSYERISALCQGLLRGLPHTIGRHRQVTLVFDGDIARTVGRLLQEEMGVVNPLLVLDGILLQDFDFIDVGRIIEPAGVVPVTIKSLIFQLRDDLVVAGLGRLQDLRRVQGAQSRGGHGHALSGALHDHSHGHHGHDHSHGPPDHDSVHGHGHGDRCVPGSE